MLSNILNIPAPNWHTKSKQSVIYQFIYSQTISSSLIGQFFVRINCKVDQTDVVSQNFGSIRLLLAVIRQTAQLICLDKRLSRFKNHVLCSWEPNGFKYLAGTQQTTSSFFNHKCHYSAWSVSDLIMHPEIPLLCGRFAFNQIVWLAVKITECCFSEEQAFIESLSLCHKSNR